MKESNKIVWHKLPAIIYDLLLQGQACSLHIASSNHTQESWRHKTYWYQVLKSSKTNLWYIVLNIQKKKKKKSGTES